VGIKKEEEEKRRERYGQRRISETGIKRSTRIGHGKKRE